MVSNLLSGMRETRPIAFRSAHRRVRHSGVGVRVVGRMRWQSRFQGRSLHPRAENEPIARNEKQARRRGAKPSLKERALEPGTHWKPTRVNNGTCSRVVERRRLRHSWYGRRSVRHCRRATCAGSCSAGRRHHRVAVVRSRTGSPWGRESPAGHRAVPMFIDGASASGRDGRRRRRLQCVVDLEVVGRLHGCLAEGGWHQELVALEQVQRGVPTHLGSLPPDRLILKLL